MVVQYSNACQVNREMLKTPWLCPRFVTSLSGPGNVNAWKPMLNPDVAFIMRAFYSSDKCLSEVLIICTTCIVCQN